MNRINLLLATSIASLSLSSSVMASEADTGIWQKSYYVDEFEMPTDNYYIGIKDKVVGKFSNTATTDSSLLVDLSYDFSSTVQGNALAIRLYEYDTEVVRNGYSKDVIYDTTIMNPSGEKYTIKGIMPSGSDCIIYSQESCDTIVNSLFMNGTVRFAITSAEFPATKYLFSIDDSTGFEEIVPYTQISSFSDGLCRVIKTCKAGYINTDGKVVIPFNYSSLSGNFREGIAEVSEPYGDKSMGNGYSGYINDSGEYIAKPIYRMAESFSEGLACVESTEESAFSLVPPFGYIDTTGAVVIPIEYDSANSFHEGLASVKKKEKYGFIDKNGSTCIDFKYDYASSFSEGLAAVKLGDKYGYINTDGSEALPFEWESATDFCDGRALVKKNGQELCIDNTGTVIFESQWDKIGGFSDVYSDGLALVKKDDKYGYINTEGEVVIPIEWHSAYSFSEGYARVQDEKFGLIDTTGALVIPCEYDNAQFGDGYFTLLKDGEITILDAELNQIATLN